MKSLQDYILVVEDVLTPEFCQQLIERFNQNDQIPRQSEWALGRRSFSEINLSQHPDFQMESNHIMNKAAEMFNAYRQICNVDFMPPNVGFEEARMKKYAANDHDEFGLHTDVGDYASARRFLVQFFYLNNVEEGGETVFQDAANSEKAIKVVPKQGSIVMFPPFWLYPHRGLKPVSNDKYILSTYAHFI